MASALVLIGRLAVRRYAFLTSVYPTTSNVNTTLPFADVNCPTGVLPATTRTSSVTPGIQLPSRLYMRIQYVAVGVRAYVSVLFPSSNPCSGFSGVRVGKYQDPEG